MFFGSNIKLLRKRRGRTQDDTALAMDLKRSTLSGYENGVAQPDITTLVAFSRYFKVSVDTLLSVDLSVLPESQLSQLEKGYDVYITGAQLRVLATTIDSHNRENIELVDEKAKAGYATGYADPEFISVLPVFQLPFLHKERKYRTFQINGDSMLPIPHGSWVTGEYVQNWNLIRDRHAYLIVTRHEGVVFKVVESHLPKEPRLILHSLNPAYEPYEIHVNDIREVWKFINYISAELPEPNREIEMARAIHDLKTQVRAIQVKLDL
ncbi:MAG TPA: LexA family transcriptional regulator [Bacteroidales bacterium]|nr:LexA family transcriptional regulator [Bacteroidales bacterium]HSA43236.1 LexA family transcriptional regulator [Bacteroidales bacterium]